MDSFFIQLLIQFLGAFFGFLFAAVLAGISGKRNEKRKIKKIVQSLIEELEDIVKPLRKYVDNNHVLSSRISTPTWDALQYSGLTIELIEKKYFYDLIMAYSLIKEFNDNHLFGKDIKIEDIKNIFETCERALTQLNTEKKGKKGKKKCQQEYRN